MRSLTHPADPTAAASRPAEPRPVMLATLDVPFDPAASALAVDAAAEAALPLLVVNVVELPPLAMSVRMGYDQLGPTAQLEDALRACTDLARALGVAVERLRVRSVRPVSALLEVIAERTPALVVFGPERKSMSARAYRRALRRIDARTTCLVWAVDE